jgi:hypothetical protein
MTDDSSVMEKTKALMQSLVRMKPKQHGEMKVGEKRMKKSKAKKKPGK